MPTPTTDPPPLNGKAAPVGEPGRGLSKSTKAEAIGETSESENRPLETGLQTPLEAIRIGHRHRQNLGDIEGLAASIASTGLLHPIVVTPSNELVCGERRIEAARRLGWKEIPARVVDIEEIVFGEQAENEVRKDFDMSERVAIGAAVEAKFGERRGRPQENVEKIPQLVGEKTRDLAAKKSGFGNGKTYEQAKAVVEAATQEPERLGKLRADMDRTGRVSGPFKRLKVMKQSAEIRREPPPLPGHGPYRVIVADPPWPYEIRKEDTSHARRIRSRKCRSSRSAR